MAQELTCPSFAESLLEQGDYGAVQSLLENNETLKKVVISEMAKSKEAIDNVLAGIDALGCIRSFSAIKTVDPWSELYIKAMEGELSDAAVLREALLMVKKMPSDTLSQMTSKLIETQPAIEGVLREFDQLLGKSDHTGAPMRSEHDIQHRTLRTTVVAQKVELSKQTSELSQQDKEYSKIVNHIHDTLRDYFKHCLINPRDLFLHEVLTYDAKSPYRDVFMPRPRFAVERALSSPHDYLGCNCCDGVEHGLSASQPATAILYQLYLESGSIINAADLWSAFHTIVAADDADDEETEQQRVL